LRWRGSEQRLYERIRPITLFGIPPAERAQETGLPERSLGRAADAFDTHGIIAFAVLILEKYNCVGFQECAVAYFPVILVS
jgi:hypothetical protein